MRPWRVLPNGFYMNQSGEMCLLVEKAGADFRVLVTRVMDEMHPEEFVYAGSAANAADAMTLAERVSMQFAS